MDFPNSSLQHQFLQYIIVQLERCINCMSNKFEQTSRYLFQEKNSLIKYVSNIFMMKKSMLTYCNLISLDFSLNLKFHLISDIRLIHGCLYFIF
ncbi:hypothetical protein C0J52_04626 [Blattella germanica]|nr:hypothetical protein C0J52_04626 [Blattella germanica]